MPSKNPVQRLTEIIENIAIIAEFTAGMVFEDYVNDRKTVYAVTRALEIISEASRRLPDEFTQRHSEVDWAGLAAAGNVYRHEYEVVDDVLVWSTIQHELGPLRETVADELKRLGAA